MHVVVVQAEFEQEIAIVDGLCCLVDIRVGTSVVVVALTSSLDALSNEPIVCAELIKEPSQDYFGNFIGADDLPRIRIDENKAV
jgi:hypothetical protein